MKRIFSIFFIIIFCLPIYVSAQRLTYIGLDAGPKWSYYSLQDYGSSLRKAAAISTRQGIVIGQEIAPNIFLESGFSVDHTIIDVRFSDLGIYSRTTGATLFQIPLRMKVRYPVYKDRLSLTASIGIIGAYNSDYTLNSSSGFSTFTATDSVKGSVKPKFDYSKYFGFAEMGLSVDYKFKNNIMLSLQSRYTQGFATLSSSDVEYTLNDSPVQAAEYKTNGSNICLQLGLKIPVSNIWDQSEGSKTIRMNNLEGIQEASKARFYLSGSGGMMTQTTTSDSPGLTGNHMLRRYSFDLPVFSVNLGYRFVNNWIAETGYAFQNFRNGYYLMEGEKFLSAASSYTSSHGYSIIPLRIKHQFYFAKNRLSISPYVGVSMLISKTSGNYFDFQSSTIDSETKEIISTSDARAFSDRKIAMTLNAGIGAEYALTKRMIFFMNADYSYGLQQINHLNVDYKSESINKEGNIFYKGTGFTLTTGVKIPLYFRMHK